MKVKNVAYANRMRERAGLGNLDSMMSGLSA
ncbi:MAG: hypothetical protein JWO51_2945 [Rhodospirillales bacterium]|nr:hypothetical protein [Rhodospirillales bacterium]